MKFHEYADLFPLMDDADVNRLAEDIKAKGQSDPIITLDGVILDGRNRYNACRIAKVEPIFADYGGDDPLGFVISHNLHRRHLNESQRGMVAAKMANMKSGERTDLGSIDLRSVSQTQAAEMLNVSVPTVKRSKSVVTKGVQELQDMVTSGEVSVKAASVVSRLPEPEQRKAVAGGVSGVRAAAAAVATEQPEERPVPKRLAPGKVIESDGMTIWMFAKQQLDRINKHDEFRVKALTEALNYCKNRLAQNK